MNRACTVFAILLATIGAARDAAAQSPEKEAQQLFEKGAALYFEGRYADALVQFKRGHNVHPNGLFQYNIALCNLRLERYPHALAAALEARTMGDLGERETTLNDARIASLVLIRSAVAVGERIEARAGQAAAAPEEPPEAIAESAAESTFDAPRRSSFGTLGWTGVAATTIGAGLLGATLAIELSLQRKWEASDSAAREGDAQRYTDLNGEIDRGQSTGRAFFYAGVGAGAVGVTLILIDLLTPGAEVPEVGLFPAPDGTVWAAWRTSF